MNANELESIRKLLMLDVVEAAENIGEVSNRTWQYWEAGRSKVPLNVSSKLEQLIQLRDETIYKILKDCSKESNEAIKWYKSHQDFQCDYPNKSKIIWKIHQSISSVVFASQKNIRLDEKADLNNDLNVSFYKCFFNMTDKQNEY